MHDALSSFPRSFETGDPDAVYMHALAALAWERAAGNTVASKTRAVAFENGRLTVATNDPTWKSNLDAMRSRYLFEMRSAASGIEINKIEFIVDKDLVLPEKHTPYRVAFERDADIVRIASVIDDDAKRERFIDTASCYIAAQKEKFK